MGLDPRLAKEISKLRQDNSILRQEVSALRGTQAQSGGNPGRMGLNSFLKITTLGKIANSHLYMPSSKISPAPPGARGRRV